MSCAFVDGGLHEALEEALDLVVEEDIFVVLDDFWEVLVEVLLDVEVLDCFDVEEELWLLHLQSEVFDD